MLANSWDIKKKKDRRETGPKPLSNAVKRSVRSKQMVDFEEIKNLLDQFRNAHNQRFDLLSHRLDQFEARGNRPPCGSGSTSIGPETDAQAEHRRTFCNSFVRSGADNGLHALEINAGMRTDNDPDGGYMVPSVLDEQIEKLVIAQSPMRQICTVKKIETPNYTKIVAKTGTASGWVGETDARDETGTPDLAALTPFLGEIYSNPAATQIQLDDAGFDVEAFLIDSIADEFSIQENTAFITGTGIKKPKGILSYDIATTADANRAFGTLQYVKTGDASGFKTASATVSPADCLVNLVYSVRQAYRQGAVWLMNGNTLGVISKFKDAVNGLPIWSRGLAEGQPSMLLGYPVIEAEDMPDVGANALPIAFGNFKRAFYIVDRMGTRMLRDPYTNKPWIHFYTTRRVGSFLNNSNAVKLLKIEA